MTIILPYPVASPTPTEFEVDSVGRALAVLQAARQLCLPASYHPNGGGTAKAYFPVTHSVFVVGTDEQLAALRRLMAKYSETP